MQIITNFIRFLRLISAVFVIMCVFELHRYVRNHVRKYAARLHFIFHVRKYVYDNTFSSIRVVYIMHSVYTQLHMQ